MSVGDIMSILQSNYLTVGSNISTTSNSKYVAVDPTAYQGNWTGQYGNGKTFAISVSNVDGFRAKVKYQSGSTVNYGDVLIKDSSFRIGDTKFILQGSGKALIATAVTDPVSGNVAVQQAYAAQG
jgi:hypothetical protein